MCTREGLVVWNAGFSIVLGFRPYQASRDGKRMEPQWPTSLQHVYIYGLDTDLELRRRHKVRQVVLFLKVDKPSGPNNCP
jgi:hypothetical protein